jgi:hypothetical protein
MSDVERHFGKSGYKIKEVAEQQAIALITHTRSYDVALILTKDEVLQLIGDLKQAVGED